MRNLYLGRRAKRFFGAHYEFGTNKSNWSDKEGFDNHTPKILCIDAENIHKYTNIRLRPGQVVRVKGIVLDVEEVKP